MDYNNITTVQGRYEQCEAVRENYLDRARESSKLTLPTLIPPSGASASTTFLSSKDGRFCY